MTAELVWPCVPNEGVGGYRCVGAFGPTGAARYIFYFFLGCLPDLFVRVVAHDAMAI